MFTPGVAQLVNEGLQEEVNRDNGDEEAGQVCVGLHKSHRQQEGQAGKRAHPPVLKAEDWEVSTKPRAQDRR